MVIMSAMLNACKLSPVFDREIKARNACKGEKEQREVSWRGLACSWQAFEREGKGNFSCAHISLHFSFEGLPRRLGEVQKTTGTTIFFSSPFTIPLIIER